MPVAAANPFAAYGSGQSTYSSTMVVPPCEPATSEKNSPTPINFKPAPIVRSDAKPEILYFTLHLHSDSSLKRISWPPIPQVALMEETDPVQVTSSPAGSIPLTGFKDAYAKVLTPLPRPIGSDSTYLPIAGS